MKGYFYIMHRHFLLKSLSGFSTKSGSSFFKSQTCYRQPTLPHAVEPHLVRMRRTLLKPLATSNLARVYHIKHLIVFKFSTIPNWKYCDFSFCNCLLLGLNLVVFLGYLLEDYILTSCVYHCVCCKCVHHGIFAKLLHLLLHRPKEGGRKVGEGVANERVWQVQR